MSEAQQDKMNEPNEAEPLAQPAQPGDTPAAVAEPVAAAPAEPAPPSLEEQLEIAQATIQEHRDAFLRAKAETDNVRKRAQTDIAAAHKYAVENFATELLAVKDSLEAALATDTAAVENLRSGVELTLKQLNAAFDKFKLTEENPAAQKFDPHRHQAISMVESEAEPNTVVSVLQKGYKLNDRVIRPALVTVAKAKAEA
jgi:molecular chaperone GrpE